MRTLSRLNCTPFVRRMIYYLTSGVFFLCQKEYRTNDTRRNSRSWSWKPMQQEQLSYSETVRRFEVNSHRRIQDWERIYLTEGPEGFAIERRGRSSKGRPPKQLPKQVEEDLLAEVQRLRAEVEYLKNLASLGFGRRATPARKTLVVQKLRQKTRTQYSALNRSTALCDLLLSSETDEAGG